MFDVLVLIGRYFLMGDVYLFIFWNTERLSGTDFIMDEVLLMLIKCNITIEELTQVQQSILDQGCKLNQQSLNMVVRELLICGIGDIDCKDSGFEMISSKLIERYSFKFKQELMETIINIINSQNMTAPSNAKQFSIIKFEQSNIQLLHKPTKRVYQYFQAHPDREPQSHISHVSLIRPVVYNNGLLYPVGLSNLQNQMQNRRRAYKVVPYEQEELFNTFTPVLECLTALHEQGIVHGGLCPGNIIITEQEQVKIKDWLVEPADNLYYFSKTRKTITKDDDIIALGQIFVQAAVLRKGTKTFTEKQLHSVLESLIDRYSKGFIFAVSVFLKKNKERFQFLQQYLKNEQKILGDIELNSLYDFVRKQKEEKKRLHKVTNENQIPNANSLKPTILSLHESPVKKATPTSSLGNTIKKIKEEGENKRVPQEQTKKKQAEKINKIIEKSNQFVAELMARKKNEHILKKIAPKPNVAMNISLYGDTHKKVQKETTFYSSPIRKIRTISRKK